MGSERTALPLAVLCSCWEESAPTSAQHRRRRCSDAVDPKLSQCPPWTAPRQCRGRKIPQQIEFVRSGSTTRPRSYLAAISLRPQEMGTTAKPPSFVCLKWPWGPSLNASPSGSPSPCGDLERPWLFKSISTVAQGLVIAGDIPSASTGSGGHGARLWKRHPGTAPGLVRELEDGGNASASFVLADAEDDRWLPELVCELGVESFCFRFHFLESHVLTHKTVTANRLTVLSSRHLKVNDGAQLTKLTEDAIFLDIVCFEVAYRVLSFTPGLSSVANLL
ncbi:unnamed protein product [Triticum turgidum subsp. durum]|uniref:Uncharacterized protein n=1 Tax=Triticum turgidum subsp. durum TaxID=4567 RepID=A0A9R0SA50_TRITD|nr:unnamed protein product [Triticum turgidum subsp. durum]